jgi:ADP-ribosylglycohydrolase
MRIAPLAVYAATKFLNPNTLLKFCMMNAKLTHTDARAGHAAYLIAYLIYKFLSEHQNRPLDKSELLEELKSLALMAEATYPTTSKDLLSKRLERISIHDSKVNYPEGIQKTFGNSPYALDSVPLAIALLFENSFDFKKSILSALMCGGDTDTNIALVGSVAGAFGGTNSIPKVWKEFRLDFQEPFTLARKLVEKHY